MLWVYARGESKNNRQDNKEEIHDLVIHKQNMTNERWDKIEALCGVGSMKVMTMIEYFEYKKI